MNKLVLKLFSVILISMITFCVSSCEEDAAEGKASIYGTWRKYTDKENGYYWQISLKENGTLVYKEYDDHEDETSYAWYTYENNYITWYDSLDKTPESIEAKWYVADLGTKTIKLIDVDTETGEFTNDTWYAGELVKIE